MKHRIGILCALACLAAAIALIAQTSAPVYEVPLWNNGRYSFPRLGPTLAVNAGQLDAIIPPAPPPVAPINFSDQETPGGALDGANQSFTLARAPKPALSLQVYRNGQLVRAPNDYALNSNTITFVPDAVPQPGDWLLAFYRY